ncbi:hypothetical protein ASPCAL02963 [Aspergillus calidoustus]|uniref:Extracellular membrane protein CFEM domain-containing protein n=1 Tax=Aspergillus calidoustus TaxID=454130 RepID=A0A0U5GPZ0_ASPCI|nr:hypothetical protein ASPCAL02963 [Aspergillus calidoustus]
MKALLFVLPTLYLPGVLAVTCYRPNGISSTNGDSKSCHSINGAPSMCCNEYYECLENGLCKVAADTGVEGSNVTYWRDTCSVSNWPEVGLHKFLLRRLGFPRSGAVHSERRPRRRKRANNTLRRDRYLGNVVLRDRSGLLWDRRRGARSAEYLHDLDDGHPDIELNINRYVNNISLNSNAYVRL